MALVLIAILAAVIFVLAKGMDPRWKRVNGCYDPKRRSSPILDVGPPIFDVRMWLNGGHR